MKQTNENYRNVTKKNKYGRRFTSALMHLLKEYYGNSEREEQKMGRKEPRETVDERKYKRRKLSDVDKNWRNLWGKNKFNKIPQSTTEK